MKITNGQVWNVCFGIQQGTSLLDKLATVRLSVAKAYDRNKIIKKLSEQFNDIAKLRDDLIKKDGKEDEEGNTSVSPEDVENFQKFINDQNELFEIEEDYKIKKLSADTLDSLELNFSELEQLSFLIDFGDEEEVETVETELVETETKSE